MVYGSAAFRHHGLHEPRVRVADMMGDENNENTGGVMMPGPEIWYCGFICSQYSKLVRFWEMTGITTVNFGREYVMFLARIQVNGGNSEYLKVISEPFAQSRGRIRQLEVAKAILLESRYTFSKMEAIMRDHSLLYDREPTVGGIADCPDG
jgi:hypothetical protein